MSLAVNIQDNQIQKLYKFNLKNKIINLNDYKKLKEQTTKQLENKKEKYQNKKIYTPVEPFKTIEEVQQAKNYFLNRPERFTGQNIRDYTIFIFGINLWKRAGDLLHLRLHNVIDEKGNIKDYIVIKEQKTGKISKEIITDVLKNTLELYLPALKHNDLNDPLFPSRNKDNNGNYKPMTVDNFYKKMKILEKGLNLNYSLGTHSMRKTGASFAVKNNPQDMRIISKVSKKLNHSNIETTFAYLGIIQNELDDLSISNQL